MLEHKPATNHSHWLVFIFLTFYRISKYSHGAEIRQNETFMVPLGNLSNTDLFMLVW